MSLKMWSQVLIWLSLFMLSTSYADTSKESDIVATIDGKNITYQTAMKGSETEIYEAEMKLYQQKLLTLKQLLISQLIAKDPRSNGINEQQFVDRYIVKPRMISEADIDGFIRDKKIPTTQVDSDLRQKVQQYLKNQYYATQIDSWFVEQSKKYHIEIKMPQPTEPRFEVNIEGAPFLGNKDAPVTMVEFSDFQCPYCAKASAVVRQLHEKYGDKLNIVYKHFPLNFHANAQKAAEAGSCANLQSNDLFWKLHDELFADVRNLTVGSIKDKAKAIGLDYEQFSTCLTEGQFADAVAEDIKEGMALGISATPAFFINGRPLRGAQPLEVFTQKIDEELAR